MIAVFDTTTLTYLLKPNAPGPLIAGSTARLAGCGIRIAHLLSELQRSKSTIVIPTPVLTELLVLAARAGPEWLRLLSTSKHFQIIPFDTLAAIECAEMAKQRLGVRLKNTEKHEAKYDEQIVAIARVIGATKIFSDDGGVKSLAGSHIPVLGMHEISLPPVEAQGSFDLEMADQMPPPPVEEL